MNLSRAITNQRQLQTFAKPRTLMAVAGLLLLLCFVPRDGARATTVLPQTFTISGRVADGHGNGISGATVFLSGAQSATTTSDGSGNYSFTNLPAGGNYNLTATKPGQFRSFAAIVNNLSADTVVNVRLDPYIIFNIRVIDAGGNGIPGVEILIDDISLGGLVMTNSSGTLILNVGVSATGTGDPPVKLAPKKDGLVFTPTSQTFPVQNGNQNVTFTASTVGGPTTFVEFSSLGYIVLESEGSTTITVKRSGDTSTAVAISYFTANGTGATEKSDYVRATGTLNFAPGETTKTFSVLIIDNAIVQGVHTVNLQLANPTGGAALGNPSNAFLSIFDNDTTPSTTTPLDTPQFFVRQHYYDFLNRLPDQTGLDYWSNQIAQCGSDSKCLTNARVGVSAAFFVEQELQDTAFLIYRFFAGSLGLVPDYAHFMTDRDRLTGGAQLPQSTLAFANDFVAGGVFAQSYPASMTPTAFVTKLFNTAQLVPYDGERQAAIQALTAGSKTRAQVVLEMLEIPELKSRLYNPAFVLMQYYGYLRRDADSNGYQFWLNILNDKLPNDPSGYRAMVCAFITSREYQDRFSPVHPHSDTECGP